MRNRNGLRLARLLSGGAALALCALPAAAQFPVGAWQAEGNALDSVGTNAARLQGGVKYAPGVLGQAFAFDGTNGVVRLPDADALKLTKSFSISAWVYVNALPDNPTGYGQIVFRGDSRGGYDPYFLAFHKSGNLVFHIGNADNRYVEIAAPMPIQQFVYVTASLDDKTGLMRISLNNRLIAQALTDIRPSRDLLLDWSPGIGIGNTQDAGINEPFNGLIDEAQIYDSVIGPTAPIFAQETAADFQQGIMKRAVLATADVSASPLASSVPAPSSALRTHTFEIDAQAYIDGNSQLLLKGSHLLWHHLEHAAPGHWNGNNFPTVISTKLDGVTVANNLQWIPKWPQAQDRDVNNETYSTALPLKIPAMSLASTLVTLQTLTDREGLRLAVPTDVSADTLVLDFDDNGSDAAAWYHAKLIFTYTEVPAQGTVITGAAGLEGVADLSQVVTPVSALTFEFRAPGTDRLVLPAMNAVLQPIPGTPYGAFHLLVPPGTYDVALKEAHTLRRVFHSVRIDGQSTLTNRRGRPIVLLGGDSGNRNAVGMEDFSALLGSFGTDGNAADTDFNHDGKVDLLDYHILLNNCDTFGDE